MDWMSAVGGAASSFGKGASLSHENRTLPGTNIKSPVMDEFGNFYRLQDEYEDTRQVNQQDALNAAGLRAERASFEQKLELAKEHGIHPLSVLGVPMATTTVGASAHESNSPISLSAGDVGRNRDPELSDHDKRMMEYNERLASANARAAESRAVSDEIEARQRAQVLLGQQVGPGRVSNDQVATQSRLSGVAIKDISGPQSIIKINPSEVVASRPGDPSLEAGVPPSLQEVLLPGNKRFTIPSQKNMQVDMEGGELIATLMNYGGLPLDAAIATTALLPIVGPAVAGLGYAAHRGYRAYRLGKEAARLAKIASRKSWKK